MKRFAIRGCIAVAIMTLAILWFQRDHWGTRTMDAEAGTLPYGSLQPDVLRPTGIVPANPISTSELYGITLGKALDAGTSLYGGQALTYPVSSKLNTADYQLVNDEVDGRNESVLVSTGKGESGGYIEWEVDVPETALYRLSFTYMPDRNSSYSIERGLLIDGSVPFTEASRFQLPRRFTESGEVTYDQEGNQLRQPVVELKDWVTAYFTHPENYYTRPYMVKLEQGKHTIRMTDTREPVKIARLVLDAPQVPPSYEEWAEEQEREHPVRATEEHVTLIEAESPAWRTNAYLRGNWNKDPLATPKGVQLIRYNTFGGDKWRLGGQEASWDFSVPADGWYQITMRIQQSSLNRVSYRQVKLDGEVPFRELEEYPIRFERKFLNHTIGDLQGEPYSFYLTAGRHTLSLSTELGPVRRTIVAVNDVVSQMGLLRRDIQQIVSSSRDANGQLVADVQRDWDLDQYIPDLKEQLVSLARVLKSEYDYLLSLTSGKRTGETGILNKGYQDMMSLSDNLEQIPLKLNEMGVLQTTLASVTQSLLEQPLEIDRLLVHTDQAELPRGTANAFEKTVAWSSDFIYSFITDRNHISSGIDQDGDQPRLTISLARGREWGTILKNMIDDDFTAATGIQVDINLLPLASEHMLLLAYTAGNAPDIAMGVNPQIPVEFAIRDAVMDLKQFPDYEEVSKRFYEGMLVPFEYQGKGYALPETQDLLMGYYRTDIFESIGIEPPETWQDVYALLPNLRLRGMDYFLPAGPQMYLPFLYQHDGEFFKGDGARSALDSPQALAAFEEWTRMYTFHAMQKQADFYQRFRTGEMPVGIGGFDVFVRLISAAPELYGKWKMTLVPGIRQPDGTINHTSGGMAQNTQSVMIMNTSKHKDAAWAFLKWWTSAETQIRYGAEVEGLLGTASRWNSANIEAFVSASWTREEQQMIEESLGWIKEQPVVLGGYYVQRQLLNAWNRVVLKSETPRIVMEDAVDEINRELSRKRKEFGLE